MGTGLGQEFWTLWRWCIDATGRSGTSRGGEERPTFWRRWRRQQPAWRLGWGTTADQVSIAGGGAGGLDNDVVFISPVPR